MKDDFQQTNFDQPLQQPLSPAAVVRVNILTLATKFRFCVENENDGLGQELFQTFRLRDGRPFALNFLVHWADQDGMSTHIHVTHNPATQKQDVRDIMSALDLGDDTLIEEYPLRAFPAPAGP